MKKTLEELVRDAERDFLIGGPNTKWFVDNWSAPKVKDFLDNMQKAADRGVRVSEKQFNTLLRMNGVILRGRKATAPPGSTTKVAKPPSKSTSPSGTTPPVTIVPSRENNSLHHGGVDYELSDPVARLAIALDSANTFLEYLIAIDTVYDILKSKSSHEEDRDNITNVGNVIRELLVKELGGLTE